jgi:CrcB protein
MMTIAAVFIGAFLAAPLRFFIERRSADSFARIQLPIGLLIVNSVGSGLAGIAFVIEPGWLRTMVVVGFCGTLTTFSGFGWQVLQRWQTARRAAWLTIAAVTVLSVSAFWFGLVIGEFLMSGG